MIYIMWATMVRARAGVVLLKTANGKNAAEICNSFRPFPSLQLATCKWYKSIGAVRRGVYGRQSAREKIEHTFLFLLLKIHGKKMFRARLVAAAPRNEQFLFYSFANPQTNVRFNAARMGQAKMQWACDFFFGCSRIKLYKNIIIFIIIFCFIRSHRISFVCAFCSFGLRSHITRTSTQWANNFDLFCCSLTFLSLCSGSPMAGDAECDAAPKAREGEAKNANNN